VKLLRYDILVIDSKKHRMGWMPERIGGGDGYKWKALLVFAKI
jgi:hypothetical protein